MSGWGHVSRHCARCGKVGPRTWHDRLGWVHLYCLDPDERRQRRHELTDWLRTDKEYHAPAD